MTDQALVLLVNRNRRNLELLEKYLGEAGYRTLAADELPGVDTALDGGPDVRLALVDVSGFERSIWSRCERIADRGIPLLVVSPGQSAALQAEGLRHGARSVLIKPLVIRELLALIASLIEG